MFAAIAAEHGGGAFEWASQEEDRARLWQARHDAFWATKNIKPGKAEAIATDVCVPISRLAECVEATRRDLEENDIYGPMIGHVGDGNFHVVLFCDRADAGEVKRVKAVYDRLIERALAMGGTCTGEHGVGIHKMGFLRDEAGSGAVDMMRAIKQALDPKNILNPGKIFAL